MGSLSEIEYGGNAFRVSRGNGEERICLDDVCAAIHRGEMLKLRTIGELCPSLAVEPDGTTWASFRDAVNMLEYARKSIWGRQRIASVLAFVRALIEEQNESAREETATEQKPDDISFEYEGTSFRARRRGGRMMFNATEMSKITGKAPFVWLKLNTTQRLFDFVVDNGFAEDKHTLVESTPGRYGHTWIDHTLLVHFGRWISDDFGVWCERLLISEGLHIPEIASVKFEFTRRAKMVRTETSVSISDREPVSPIRGNHAFKMPESLDEARALLARWRPKADYYDEQVENRKWFPNSFLANELGITIRQLNMFLEKAGVQERKDDKWVVCMSHRAVPLKTEVPYDNPFAVNQSNTRSVWTPYGRKFVHGLWNENKG